MSKFAFSKELKKELKESAKDWDDLLFRACMEAKEKELLIDVNNKEITNEFFENIILYPDQLVYLNDSISVNGEENILNINTENGDLVYNTNIELAQTIEETLLAYIYVINKIKECGMEVKSMTKQQVDYIRNWESEKYRKRMV